MPQDTPRTNTVEERQTPSVQAVVRLRFTNGEYWIEVIADELTEEMVALAQQDRPNWEGPYESAEAAKEETRWVQQIAGALEDINTVYC